MDIFVQIKEEMKKVYLRDRKPIALAFSGGKDSSLMLTLLWEMLLELPKHLRTKTVHVMNSNTGVEAPVMEQYMENTLLKIENQALIDCLPIQVMRVKPSKKDNFWYRVLGRGNLLPTPNTKHRGCTFWLKINPTQDSLKELISQASVDFGDDKTALTLWLGTRVEESARRAASIAQFQVSADSLFSKHSDFDEVMCFMPIKFVSADELWLDLICRGTLPYGVTAEELAVQYGEGILECGIKTSSEQGNSCGGSGGRLGCWTCGMVSGDDPMLLRFIEEGQNYQGLLEWKNIMLAMRNDIRYREVFPRQQYNRFFKANDKPEQIDLFNTDEETKNINNFETYRRNKYDAYSPGGMTFEGRRLLLEHLLYIEERDGLSLICEDEIQAVLDAWEDTEGICIQRSDIAPKRFDYDGQLIFLPDKTINKKATINQNKVFYLTVELNKEDSEFYSFMKERQRVNQSSIFFFPDSQEFKDKKLVWNKATFVVCKKGIKTQTEAAEHLYKWLGWHYGFFTKDTFNAAINHLILSALSEGFTKKTTKLSKAKIQLEPLPVTNSEDGQLAFAI